MVRKWLQEGEDMLNERLAITGVVFAPNLTPVEQQIPVAQADFADFHVGAAELSSSEAVIAARAVLDSHPCIEETAESILLSDDLVAFEGIPATIGADSATQARKAAAADKNQIVGVCVVDVGDSPMDESAGTVANAESIVLQGEMAPPVDFSGLNEDDEGIQNGKSSSHFTEVP